MKNIISTNILQFMFCGIILAEVMTMVLSQNTIIENLDDGVLIIDSSGNIINANISAE